MRVEARALVTLKNRPRNKNELLGTDCELEPEAGVRVL
jgi:hypothetical protein